MKKKQLMYVSIAATALASCMTSCIENEEGDGLKALREGQANYWIAKGEAEKISANAELVAAQGLAELQAAQAKVQEAEAKAKEAQIALTEAQARQAQIANDYAEKKNALDLELQKAMDELAVAKAEAALKQLQIANDYAEKQNALDLELRKALDELEVAKASADNKNAIAAQELELELKKAMDELALAKAKADNLAAIAKAEQDAAKIQNEIEMENANHQAAIAAKELELEMKKVLDELAIAKAKADNLADLAKAEQLVATIHNAIAKANADNQVDLANAEKNLASAKNAIEKAEAEHKIAMDALEQTRVANEEALYEAKKALVEQKELYEAAILKAEEDLATAKKDHEVSMASIQNELDKLEETKAQYIIELEQLKKENATANATKDEELRQAAIAQEITVIQNNLDNYNDIVGKINTAYTAFVEAQKAEIDANATYAQAIDAYTAALATAANDEIDAVVTKEKDLYDQQNVIKDKEYELLTSKRDLVTSERALARAKEALAKFNETDKASAESVLEAMKAENENIKKLQDQDAAKQLEIEKATIVSEEAEAALEAAKAELEEVRDSKIAEISKSIWALDDKETVNGETADDELYYSKAEELAAELQAAEDVMTDAKAANQEAYDKKIAELDKEIAAVNEANDLLDEDIKNLNKEISAKYDELQDKFQEISGDLAKAYDAQMAWYDTKVKDFKLTVGENIASEVSDYVMYNALDVNSVTYFDVKGSNIVLSEAYEKWLTNAALTGGSTYKYNYVAEGTTDEKNKYAENYVEKRIEMHDVWDYYLGAYVSTKVDVDYTFKRNNWQPSNEFKMNPIVGLKTWMNSMASAHESAFTTAKADRVAAVNAIATAAYAYDPSLYDSEKPVVNEDATDYIQLNFNPLKNKISEEKKAIETSDPNYRNDDTWKTLDEMLSKFDVANSTYNLNLAQYNEYAVMMNDLSYIIYTAYDAYSALEEAYANEDTKMGIAFKNIVDAQTKVLTALREKVGVKEAEKAVNDTEISRIEDVDKAAALKAQTDADKAAEKVYADAAEANADKVAENQKAIKALKKEISEAELEYTKALTALKERDAVDAANSVLEELKAEKDDIATDIEHLENLVKAYDKLYTYIILAETHKVTTEALEDVLADTELKLTRAVEDAEHDLEVANRDVEEAETAVKNEELALEQIKNLDYETEYDAVKKAEDDLAKAKLDLEAAEKTFEIAKKEYEDAVAAWNKYLGTGEEE